jgi:hypothetical protein
MPERILAALGLSIGAPVPATFSPIAPPIWLPAPLAGAVEYVRGAGHGGISWIQRIALPGVTQGDMEEAYTVAARPQRTEPTRPSAERSRTRLQAAALQR